MSQINPFTGAIIMGAQIQQRQGAEKERHIRRLQNLTKNAALQGDQLEHQVESSDALHAINDQGHSNQPNRRRPHPATSPLQQQKNDDQPDPHIDLTA